MATRQPVAGRPVMHGDRGPGGKDSRAGSGSRIRAAFLAALLTWTLTGAVWALDGASVARLKRAGVDDEVIAAMVRERSVETGAFSVEEILAMKAAGVGDRALQTLIAEGSFLKDREPIVYGGDFRALRFATAEDIIRLKQAGVGDEVLEAVVAASRSGSDAERNEALRLLERMGIWVDVRR